ncbi:MAG: helix-turn-helix domain-containing protein [Christensenellales bacterium]|mgnify:CR=1 FL=1|jgi:transcriptional regulator with XRE-family HTH domain
MIINLSARLRELRLSKNLKQEQVATIIGVDKSTISLYENNSRQPSIEILIRFASFYRVSIDYLLGQTQTISLDLNGLTDEDVTIITELVATIARKNELLRQLKDRRWNYGENT